MITTLLTALLLAASPAPQAPAPGQAAVSLGPALVRQAERSALPDGSVQLKYALKIVGQTIGEPEIHVGPISQLKDGRSIRKLVFKSSVVPRLMRMYPARTDFTTILDATTYTPMRSHYDLLQGDRTRVIDIRYDGPRLRADVVDRGKPLLVLDEYLPGMVDTISSAVWLAAQDLKVGEKAMAPHHSTNHRYLFVVEAEAIEEMRVPAGTFQSVRVKCQLVKPAGDDEGKPVVQAPEAWAAATGAAALPTSEVRTFGPPASAMPTELPTGEATATWRLWLTDDKWRIPVRLVAKIPVLGNITLDLVSRRIKP